MTPHATLLPATPDARYHARRRARLVSALGSTCAGCGARSTLSRPAGWLEIDHTHGGGTELRAANGNAGEVTRLLGLSESDLFAQVRLLCPACHASVPTTVRFARK